MNSDVDIHFVKEDVVLSPNSHSSAKFMHGIKVLMAKQYVDNLSEEVEGHAGKGRAGDLAQQGPDGLSECRRAKRQEGHRSIRHRANRQRMFERYATGNFSMEDVGRMAMEEGLH